MANISVQDFFIVEYNSEIGGRCRHAPFGKDGQGNPYTVELGADWVCPVQNCTSNPIWTLVMKQQPTYTGAILISIFPRSRSTMWKTTSGISRRL